MAEQGVRDYAARRAQFKKVVDSETGARHREEHAVKIRKDKRAQQERAKRLQLADAPTPGELPAIPVAHMTPAHFQSLVSDVFGGDEAKAHEATAQFRKMLSSEKHPPIETVMRLGVAPKFVEFLRCTHNTQLQFEAAWALTNIASGTTEQTRYVIDLGAVPYFVALLDSPSPDVREQAVWALGNIAGDSHVFRDLVLAAGAVAPIVRHMTHTGPLCFVRNGMWAISNLCRGKPTVSFEKVSPLLPTLAAAIYSGDQDVIVDALWTLSYLSDGDNARVQTCLEAGITQRVVQLLVNPQQSVQVPALRTVGNIVTGDEIQTQLAINAGALPCLLMLLKHGRRAVKKEAAWTISNIMAGNRDQIKAVMECNIVQTLVLLMASGDFEIKKEAVWCISNATSGGSPDQIYTLVRCGCVPPLVDVLGVDNDSKMVTVALEGIENILRSGDIKFRTKEGGENPYVQVCIDANIGWHLQGLADSASRTIADKAQGLITTYFWEEAGDGYYDGDNVGADEDDGDPEYGPPYGAAAAPTAAGVPPQQQAPPPQHFAFGAPQQPFLAAPPAAPVAAAGLAWGAAPPQPPAGHQFNFNFS